MSILAVLAILVAIGVGLYLVGLIPMDPVIAQVIRALVILAVILWILNAFFGLGIHIGHFR